MWEWVYIYICVCAWYVCMFLCLCVCMHKTITKVSLFFISFNSNGTLRCFIECFVFDCGPLVDEVLSTIGQAFVLAQVRLCVVYVMRYKARLFSFHCRFIFNSLMSLLLACRAAITDPEQQGRDGTTCVLYIYILLFVSYLLFPPLSLLTIFLCSPPASRRRCCGTPSLFNYFSL